MVSHSDFWTNIHDTCAQLEHERNLAGKTLAKCVATKCKNGNSEPSRIDYAAHGSYHVPATPCRACGGRGRVEVACSPELELAAVEKEVAGLQKRARELRKKVKRSGRGMEW